MPYITRKNRELIFLHIPKTGGTSFYHSLCQNGWHVKGLENTGNPNGILEQLKKNYNGRVDSHSKITYWCWLPQQHALPIFLKRRYRSLESIAIIRDPLDRYVSAASRLFLESNWLSFDEFVQNLLIKKKKNPLYRYTSYAGHFIPQKSYINDKTRIFSFSKSGFSSLASFLNLDKPLPKLNVGKKNPSIQDLRFSTITKIKKLYKHDYLLWESIKE